MSIIYLLIPISLILLGVAIWAFFWAVDNNQFDDMDGPAHSILFDDDTTSAPKHRHQEAAGASAAPPNEQDEPNKR